MSEPGSATPPVTPGRYTGGQIAMIVFGLIFLLPGGCALAAVIISFDRWNPNSPFNAVTIGIWTTCFSISAVGIALIVFAIKLARRPP